MKKIFTHLKGGLLLAIMMICCMSATAAEVTILTDDSKGWANSEVVTSITQDGITISLSKAEGSSAPAYYNTGKALRLYSVNTMTISAGSAIIKKVTFNFSAAANNLSRGTGKTPLFDAGTYTEDGVIGVWEGNVNEFTLTAIDASGHARISNIVIETEASAVAVSKPTFSVKAGTYYEAQSVELKCATEGAEIHYTIDGTEPSAASAKYAEAISIDATTTIKAIAVKGSDLSEIAEAAYTIKEYTRVENIAAFIASNTTEANSSEPVIITNPVTVLYQSGNYLFVQDNTGSLQIFGNVGQTYVNGDVIPAGIKGTSGYYGKRYQMVPAAETFKPSTENSPVAATVKTISEITSADHCELVVIKNVTITPGEKLNFTLTCGEETFAGYNRFDGMEIPATEETYSVTGILNEYNGKMQLFPIEFTVTTSLNGTKANASVIASKGAIRVNAVENGNVVIVNALGQVVSNAAISEGENTFGVAKGLYIVKANGKTTKVLVK